MYWTVGLWISHELVTALLDSSIQLKRIVAVKTGVGILSRLVLLWRCAPGSELEMHPS
jgi:hypothetical protein